MALWPASPAKREGDAAAADDADLVDEERPRRETTAFCSRIKNVVEFVLEKSSRRRDDDLEAAVAAAADIMVGILVDDR